MRYEVLNLNKIRKRVASPLLSSTRNNSDCKFSCAAMDEETLDVSRGRLGGSWHLYLALSSQIKKCTSPDQAFTVALWNQLEGVQQQLAKAAAAAV